MIRKDLHVQTEQITLCVSRFHQTDDSDQSATQIHECRCASKSARNDDNQL